MDLKRLLQFLSLLSPWGLGFKSIEVAEAFEAHAQNQVARRHGMLSCATLLIGATFLLIAAVMNSIPNRRIMSERLGECGLACLVICVYQGLRYKDANGLSQKATLEDDERMK